jgi:multidrug efflux pump subunit AcrB
MFLIHFAIRKPLLTNLLMILVVIIGYGAWRTMPQEMFPVVELDKIGIKTVFEGASPAEVERQITAPLEEALDGFSDIDLVTSVSNENISNITVKLRSGGDIDDLVREIESAIDQIKDFPDEADEPEITRLKTRFPVISVSLYGDVPPGKLFALADQIQQELLVLPGVDAVGDAGVQDWEMQVVVDPQKLAAYQVTLAEVRQALRAGLADLPGGSLKSTEGDILLRGRGIPATPERIRAIVVRTNQSGGQLLLGRIASVQFQLEEALSIGHFNGQRSVNLTLSKTSEASSIKVAKHAKAYVANKRANLPENINIGLHSDMSEYVKIRLNTVKSSGLIGLIFVLTALYVFVNFRVALITALGIPVSLLFATACLYYLGHSINMVTLFAFLLCLGLIVDDSIIVTENIYRHIELGEEPHAAAEIGAKEVFWPVVASTATSVAAFMPMFAISGTMGAFIAVIPVVVTSALLGSYLEAFAVLPSHAAEMLKLSKRSQRRPIWGKLLHLYQQSLSWSLANRYFVSLLAIGFLVISMVYAGTRLPFQMFAKVEIGQFFINVEAPNTYSLKDSEALADVLEKTILSVVPEHELKSLLTNVGVTFIDFHRIRLGSQYIQFVVDLKKPEPVGLIEKYISPLMSLSFSDMGTRQRSTSEVINVIRQQFQSQANVQRMTIMRPQGGPAGAEIEIGVTGRDPAKLRKHASTIVDLVEKIPGTQDVAQDMDPGKLEYHYQVNELGKSLGITQAQIAASIRSGFLGEEVVHVTNGDKRLPVRMIFPEKYRQHSDIFKHIPITISSSQVVYLGDIAKISKTRGFSAINHRDGLRLATIVASVDDKITTPLEVTQKIQKATEQFSQNNPGYALLFLGEKKESAESIAGMKNALIIALVVIFFILSALFNSLLDPFVVMFAIPFSLIGVVIGHAILGYHLQFLSMIGFLALAGIVVNDSLILVEFAKRRRLGGMSRCEAIIEAGKVRIRPILLTSLTTFLGVSPLIFFSTGQTAFLAPMAVSLGFGLLFATILILLVLPCFYLIVDDFKRLFISK